MLGRCGNPKNKQYHDYGGRGITVCDRWKKWENFMHDMHPRPSMARLDRIENDNGYAPSNCRWVTTMVSNKNKRRYKTSSTGIAGVHRHTYNRNSFVALLRHNGKTVLNKSYQDFFEACCARKSAELIYVVPYVARNATNFIN